MNSEDRTAAECTASRKKRLALITASGVINNHCPASTAMLSQHYFSCLDLKKDLKKDRRYPMATIDDLLTLSEYYRALNVWAWRNVFGFSHKALSALIL